MVSPELSARLRYLNDSAHLLALSAPGTSRHLMSRVDALLFENNLEPPESHRREVCGACGTIMTVESGAKIKVEPAQPVSQKRRPKRKSNVVPTKRARVLIHTCGACGRYTRHVLGPPPVVHRGLRSKLNAEATPKQPFTAEEAASLPRTSTKNTSSASLTSKKRAKARKHSSLEAILARQKAAESSSSGFGLDLMDFMKKS